MTIIRSLSNSADNYNFYYIASLITINHHLGLLYGQSLTLYCYVIFLLTL
jgi:hypothetical protein